MIICLRLFSSSRVKSSLSHFANLNSNASDYIGKVHSTQFRLKDLPQGFLRMISIFSKPEIWGGTSFPFVFNCLHVIPETVLALWGQKSQERRINYCAQDCKTNRYKEIESLMTMLGYKINALTFLVPDLYFSMQNKYS